MESSRIMFGKLARTEQTTEDKRKFVGTGILSSKDCSTDRESRRRGYFRACCAISFVSAVLAVLFTNLWATERDSLQERLYAASTIPNSRKAAIPTDGEDAPLHYMLDRFSALRRNAGRDESYERGTTDAKAGEAAEHLREIQELLLRLSTEETELEIPPNNATFDAAEESQQWVIAVEKALKDMSGRDPVHGARQGRPCSKQADCLPGRNLVCVRPRGVRSGACRCPVMNSGNSVCTQRPASMPRWCVLHMEDHMLAGVAMLKEKNSHSVLRTPRILSRQGKDLAQRADWSRCAVVASSAALSRSLYGEEIDSHTAVIRFNDAPTKGFERQVGSKTTLRLQNVERCGYAERREMCLQYSKTHVCRNQGSGGGRGSCTWVNPSQRLLDYVQLYWPISKPPGGRKSELRKLSAGFLGVTLALHLCGTVDVYGFQSGSDHYYKRHDEKRTPFSERHSWDRERKCMSLLKGQQELQRVVRFH